MFKKSHILTAGVQQKNTVGHILYEDTKYIASLIDKTCDLR